MKKFKNAFTLVELIVVITILAILSTIAFVSYSWYSRWARDTNRISSLSMIWKAMEVYSMSSDLPLPENYVEIRDESNIVAYQWDLSKQILWKIGYHEEGLDPKDEVSYTYYLSNNLKDYQLMWFLEEPYQEWSSANLIINNSFALDYSNRYTFLFWKKLWTFTDINNIAIQNIEVIKSMPTPYIDISNLADTYKAHIWTDSFIEWTGTDLQIISDNIKLWWATSSCSNLLSKFSRLKWKDWYYLIAPEWANAIEVYCDMTIDWGGWIRYLNIKWNYSFADAKNCWLWNKINNSELECFNPNRFNIDILDKMMWKIWWNIYYYTPVNTKASTTTKYNTSRYCLWNKDYMTIMKDWSFPNPDASDTRYIRLWLSYCWHSRSIWWKSSSSYYMNYERNDWFWPDPWDSWREASAELTEIYIR